MFGVCGLLGLKWCRYMVFCVLLDGCFSATWPTCRNTWCSGSFLVVYFEHVANLMLNSLGIYVLSRCAGKSDSLGFRLRVKLGNSSSVSSFFLATCLTCGNTWRFGSFLGVHFEHVANLMLIKLGNSSSISRGVTNCVIITDVSW